jgi:hypothetical protein
MMFAEKNLFVYRATWCERRGNFLISVKLGKASANHEPPSLFSPLGKLARCYGRL